MLRSISAAWCSLCRFILDILRAVPDFAWAVLLVAACNMLAAMNIFISYGTWLAREYGLGAVALGTVALILGVADLGGSVLMSLLGDKMGLRRGVMIGTFLAVVGYGLLPLLNQGLVLAVVGLIVSRFAFEFSVVGVIALVSEQSPAHRGKMMTLAAAAAHRVVVAGRQLAQAARLDGQRRPGREVRPVRHSRSAGPWRGPAPGRSAS